PNGNIVVTDPFFDVTSGEQVFDAGAVFLYNGATRQLISMMTGNARLARIGQYITVLANGNFVVYGDVWNSITSTLMSGVRLCHRDTGCSGMMTSTNTLTGNDQDDYVGSTVYPLTNGNYVVGSPRWDNVNPESAGAATFCDGEIGCTGVVSTSNSFVGDHAMDRVGGFCDPCPRGIIALPNGNYVVPNLAWNGNRGAVTLGNGNTGLVGTVSTENSIVGTDVTDEVSYGGILVLPSGDFVIKSPYWNNFRGAATYCSATAGCSGIIGSDNSLVGSNSGDTVGQNVTALLGSKYVVAVPNWDRPSSIFNSGAVVYCSGPCQGAISESNSLYGASEDKVGTSVTRLSNGNFVVGSTDWQAKRGAVTFVDTALGRTGLVTQSNSLVGTIANDAVEQSVTPLTNGNYVVNSSRWNNSRGAATLCDGFLGSTGAISSTNSLVGERVGDRVGFGSVALTNGNYVVTSGVWNASRGASTFCNGLVGCSGVVSEQNSLVGQNPNDRVALSGQGAKALSNGNYVVVSPRWNEDRGAITFANGQNGLVGIVSAANSFVGANPAHEVGVGGVLALSNGDYVVNSSSWSDGSVSRVGAVTYRDGTSAEAGTISAANSLIGSRSQDLVGFDSFNGGTGGGVYALPDGGYVVRSSSWSSQTVNDAGAITLLKDPRAIFGPVAIGNSVLGSSFANGPIQFAYDPINSQVVVARPTSNRVIVIFRSLTTPTPTQTPTLTPTATPTATPTPVGFEADVAPRSNGDGAILSTDVTQIRRFVSGLDMPSTEPNEFQRTDSAPRSTLGDGALNSSDVVQARRYAGGLDPLTAAGGPAVAADPPLRASIGGELFGNKVCSLSFLSMGRVRDGVFEVDLAAVGEVAGVSFRLRYDTKMGRPVVRLGDGIGDAVLTVNDSVEGELTVLIDSAGAIGSVGKEFRLVQISFGDGSADGMVVFDGEPSVADVFGNEVRVGTRTSLSASER
ncbi:MAG: hypothetical protein ABL952_14130, partial [Pyrinomonadaceae bacterium]